MESDSRIETPRTTATPSMTLLDDLNSQQREAVVATEGPVLVLAGAGTGKTRVITYRVAYLVSQGTPGDSILAVTFTNKAADEMKQRIRTLVSAPRAEPWVGTFHSFCARLLRREAPRIALRRDFAIYDEEDQLDAVKLALAQLDEDTETHPPRGIRDAISQAKNRGWSLEVLEERFPGEKGRGAAAVFPLYERILAQANALDFDDLLLRALQVLDSSPEARRAWSERYAYIHVDEYQDINKPQYELLRRLTEGHCNICVVGDEDQSIYRWRGAEPGIILGFAEDFAGARIIRLEKNYRSTQNILDAAGAVVAHNARRLGKTLQATRPGGARLRFFEATDAAREAQFVLEEIQKLRSENAEARIAVLYRTNFQSRAFEEALHRANFRYKVLGGFSFYQRAEIKDALAYVRLVFHPDDDVALLRVINTPPRGIGKGTLDALRGAASERACSLWAAITAVIESGSAGRSLAPLRDFRELVEGWTAQRDQLEPVKLFETILDQAGYLDHAERQDQVEDTSRLENLKELVRALADAMDRGETLADYLDRAALVSDADSYDERVPITLMTLHSAKGLEFDHVFLAGLEEGRFPHSRAQENEMDLEEERRLCYVGMTRAKDTLTLTRALYRRAFGESQFKPTSPSRFLNEIPGELIETVAGSLASPGETRRYEREPESFFGPRARRRPWAGGVEPAPPRKSMNPLIGMRVRHPTYGVGTILQVEDDGEDRKLTVSFPGFGAKKLIERYAHLEEV